MLLKNKTAVITGCNRGIGKKILETYSKNGATVFACVREITTDFKKLTNIISSKTKQKIIPIQLDLSKEEQVKSAATEILNANAYIENMDGTVLTIDIYGDFKLSVGMVINCRILKSIEGPNEKRGQDLYLSGKYIVASIDHRFADEYIMQVLLKKDSYIESLDKRIANS